MDNQHLSPDEGKVQRSSRKRVLGNIIWETPRIDNAVYVYTLKASDIDEVRYIGITVSPTNRYSQHHTSKKNIHKDTWIRSVYSRNAHVIMTVIESYSDVEDALFREEELIRLLPNLTNIETSPTTPNKKECYVHDTVLETTTKFDSVAAACSHYNLSYPYSVLTAGRYVFNDISDYDKSVKQLYTLKATNGDTIIYAISQKDMVRKLECSKNMVNLVVMKKRRQVKGWVIAKIEDEFYIRENNHIRKVICDTDGLMYESIKEAAAHYSIDESSLTKVCKRKRKTIKGLVFSYL